MNEITKEQKRNLILLRITLMLIALCTLVGLRSYLKNEEEVHAAMLKEARYVVNTEEDFNDALERLIKQHTQIETLDPLQSIHATIAWSFKYDEELSGELPDTTNANWQKEWAEHILKTGSGNCVHFASLMYEAAKEMGYQCRQCIGEVYQNNGKSGGPHSWVEVKIGEK